MGFGDILQKALYLGVGLASVASETATTKLADLRVQAKKVTDDLVARGEITTEQAQKLIDELIQQAQDAPTRNSDPNPQTGPRRIEILEDEPEPKGSDVGDLRDQVLNLQAELQRLRRES
ncbi:phasin family protein [Leptolyngbya sp. FACHB-261]|uniref:phasin family protein n=1 Tax=Leptolyngbya sp. FACHB-261 TaxID=2692806 RepID=UPI0016838A45|nr:hypothetical protein [Leptolyngbya sp. FACHB-261]MBD2103502.1 hypothetical protein [Leptolyngbya sp. FACHB-261]